MVTTPDPLPLIPEAGRDLQVFEGQLVCLDGTSTVYNGDDRLSFRWRQTKGAPVELTGKDRSEAHFTAPSVDGAATLVFSLTVRDGKFIEQDLVTVDIVDLPPPHAVIDVLPEITIRGLQLVTLDGSNSLSADEGELTYSWKQVSGPSITIADPTAPITTFLAPSAGGPVEIELTVERADMATTSAVTLNIIPSTAPPAPPAPTSGGGGGGSNDTPIIETPPLVAMVDPGTTPADDSDEDSDEGDIDHSDDTPDPEDVIPDFRVVNFSLINAVQNAVIDDHAVITDEAILRFNELPPLNIRANTDPPMVGSVTFRLYADGQSVRVWTENGAPYSLWGDRSGDYNAWPPLNDVCTDYRVVATPYWGPRGTGVAGTPVTLRFRAVAVPGAGACDVDADCDDGVYCNGPERCSGGTCLSSSAPCGNSSCDEGLRQCVTNADSTCTADFDCDDLLFCNGVETCAAGQCRAGTPPCNSGLVCVENASACLTPAGGTYYVQGGLDGVDSTLPVGTIDNPFMSIHEAVSTVQAGSTILVRGGVYTGSSSVNSRILYVPEGRGGAPGAPIIVKPFPGEKVILDGRAQGTSPRNLIEILGSHIEIEGFEMRNVERSAVLIRAPAHHITVRLAHIHNFSIGAATRGGVAVEGPCEYIVIEDCVIHGPGGVGIFLDEQGGLGGNDKAPPNGSNPLFPAVPPSRWDSWPGYVGNAPRYCTVQRCVVFGMDSSVEGSDGIALNYAIECNVVDNIVFNNYDDNIDGLGATRCTFAHNICFGANVTGNGGGDGNGLKIGVRGALGNLVHHNICFDNARAGIDMTLSYRSDIYNNTCVDNGWRGISYGDTINQMQENPSRIRIKNNLCITPVGVDPRDNFAMAKSAATDTSLMQNAANAVDDNNIHGNAAWSIPLGTGSITELNDATALPQWINTNINTNVQTAQSPLQIYSTLRAQITARFRPANNSPLIDAGVSIPGITGNRPNIGAVQD